MTLVHEDRIEDIDQRLIDKECLEQRSHNGGALSQDQKGAIDPRAGALEDGEKRDLREICEQKEDDVDEGRKEDNGDETGLE